MSGFSALSIDPEVYPAGRTMKVCKLSDKWVEVPLFTWDLFLLTYYHQHRGQKYSGLSTADKKGGQEIRIRTHRGLFRTTFENDLLDLEGTLGIGHISDSTRQPLLFETSPLGPFTICFDGNLINHQALVDEFNRFGRALERSDDVAILGRLIAQGNDFVDGFAKATEIIKGSFVSAILTPKEIFVAQSPDGHKPAVIGKKKGAIAVTSESSSFYNAGFTLVRDLKPGEIIRLKQGKLESLTKIEGQKQLCTFEWVYTGFPPSIIFGLPDSLVRKILGAIHARRDIKNGFIPDFVIPVPDSGRFHAIGYKQEFDIALMAGLITRVPLYDEFLIKWPFAGRSFIPDDPEVRAIEAKIKLIPGSESLLEIIKKIKGLIERKLKETKGKKIIIDIVICDDSIVRGTQTATDLVPKLMSLIKWIKSDVEVEIVLHFRISNPPLLSFCQFGKSTKEGEELAAVNEKGQQRPAKEIAQRLGVRDVAYNSIEDFAEATGRSLEELKELCVDCDRLPK